MGRHSNLKVMFKEDSLVTSSPTSVSDFDDNSTVSSAGVTGHRVLEIGKALDSNHDIAWTNDGNNNEQGEKIRKQTRLAPVEESPSCSNKLTVTFSEDEKSSPPYKSTISSHSRESFENSPSDALIRVNHSDEGMDRAAVEKYNTEASALALRGDEIKALKAYKKALRLTRREVTRIDRQLRDSQDKPTILKTTIHVVLYQEWSEVALIIAEIRTMMAIIYERTGDYDRAIRCCKEARDVYHRQSLFDKKQNREKESSSRVNSARMEHMATKMEEARDTYEIRRQLHEDSTDIYRELSVTNDEAVKDLLLEDVFDKLSAALALELESLGQNHPQVADTLAFLSKLHMERSDAEKAIGTMKRAVSMAEISLGTVHPRTGEKYHDAARIYEELKRDDADLDNGILYYEKAISTYRKASGDYSRLLGSMLNDVGVLHLQRKQYDQAIHKLSDSLESYEASISDSRGMFADTAQVWRNLAECYVLRKEWNSATMAFKSALEIQQDARKLYDTRMKEDKNVEMPSLVSDDNIGDTLKRLGRSYAKEKQYEDSFSTLMEALTLFQNCHERAQEAAKTDDTIDLSEKQDQVAHILYCIAEVMEADKKPNEAIKLYGEALEVRIASDKRRPIHKKLNHVHCAMCLAGIGSIRMTNRDNEGAFKSFNKALKCTRLQNLPEFHPIVRMLWDKSKLAAERMAEDNKADRHQKRTLSGNNNKNTPPAGAAEEREYESQSWYETACRLEQKAKSQKSKGDIEGAIESIKIVLEFRKAFFAKNTKTGQYTPKSTHEVARTLVYLARLLQMIQEDAEAEDMYVEALDLYQQSGSEKHKHCAQDLLRELEKLKQKNSNSRVNLSITRAEF